LWNIKYKRDSPFDDGYCKQRVYAKGQWGEPPSPTARNQDAGNTKGGVKVDRSGKNGPATANLGISGKN